MIAVDTNVVIRFLTHDDERQYKKVFSLFNSGSVFIPDTVIQETEWVLRYAYKFSVDEICSAMAGLFGLENVHLANSTRIAQAIEWHRQGLDFSDALHLGRCQENEKFYTFDKSLFTKGKMLGNCSVVIP